MKKILPMILLMILLFVSLHGDEEIPGLQNVPDFQKKVQHIHISLMKMYPIAVARQGTFFIYDLDPLGVKYEMVKKAPTPWPVQKGLMGD